MPSSQSPTAHSLSSCAHAAAGSAPVAHAMGALFERHFDLVFRLFCSLGFDAAELDDAVVSVFAAAQREGTVLLRGEHRDAALWLCGRAHQRAQSRAEQRGAGHHARNDGCHTLRGLGNPAPTPAAVTTAARFGALDLTSRALLMLVDVEGLPLDSVARALALGDDVVRVRLRDARAALNPG